MATRLTGSLTVAYRATAGAALAMLSMLLLSGIAQAQGGPVWRCVDGSGRPQYTNVQADTTGKQCTAVTKEVSVVRPPAGNSPPPQSGLRKETCQKDTLSLVDVPVGCHVA